MPDACYDVAAVTTAVDLANTERPVKGEDVLATVEQLRAFLDDHLPAGSWPPPTADDLAEVRAVRATVRGVLERAGTDPDGAAEALNEGLRRARATPALRRDGDRWSTGLTADADRCAPHLAAVALGALAAVIAALGPARLGVCGGPHCRATFVDLSRNGSKQYCTRTCAHRVSVAAYRSRQGPQEPGRG